MKHYLFIGAVGLASCSGNVEQKHTDSGIDSKQQVVTQTESRQYCFIRTEGSKNQDTTTIHLLVQGNEVTGDMDWMPSEKDSRRGTLKGTLNGDEIQAVWSYMQEGMPDSISVSFKLSQERLTQKPIKFNTATNREETDDQADYQIIYRSYDADLASLSEE